MSIRLTMLGNITVTPSETVAPVETPKVLAPAPVESQPIAETQ